MIPETFKEFVCWREDAVLAATPRDAASLTEGHFQAIHHPLRLRRRRLDQREGGDWATEADVLKALRGPVRPDGYLFIPVVGGSGTGKSHLVRWVKDQSKGELGWERRYLPKNRTGLRRAIEIIIRDLNGPRIDEAREALLEAPGFSETDDILSERLLDELALLVSQQDHQQTRAQEDNLTSQLRRKLSRELPDLLRDPVVRRKLVADGAVIKRLVGLSLRGRDDGDGLDDDATRFRNTDFPLSFEEIGNATKGARELLSKLSVIPKYMTTSVAMINEALPAAEKRVAISNHVDLVEIFREVRRALHSDGRQLALFVEDLTVLHGVEREFLDAIVEPKHSADGEMCNLRMIFAVTEGHFDDIDTVRTRCDDGYWLDAPYGDDGVDEDEALSFVARYFNASRMAPEQIDADWDARDDSGENWLKNACKTCVHQEPCHETFGTSREGYGLYPLNATSAERFVGALSTERFDPRDVVREVVNRLLMRGSVDLRRGAFPSTSTLVAFDKNNDPLQPLIAARLKGLRPVDYDRVSNILRFWADSSIPPTLDSSILEALGVSNFSVDLLSLQGLQGSHTPKAVRGVSDSGVGNPKSSGTATGTGKTREGIEGRLKSAHRKHFDELAVWLGNQRELSATATNYLRKAVVSIVQQNLEFGALPINLGADFDAYRFGEKDVLIAGTVTSQSVEDAMVMVDRSEVNAVALQALILFKEIETDDWAQSDMYRRILASVVDNWTAAVVARLELPTAASTISVVRSGVVVSAVLGHLGRAPTNSDYIAALFAPARTAGAVSNRSAKWIALVDRASKAKTRIQMQIQAEFGESRGRGGGVRMVRGDRLLPIVKDFASTWEMDTSDPANAALIRAVIPAVDEEWEALQRKITEVRALIDVNRSWEDQSSRVLAALRTAHQVGRLPDTTALADLSNLAEQVPARVLRSFVDIADSLTRDVTLREKLVIVASEIPGEVTAMHQFTVRAEAAMQSVERSLAVRQSETGGATDLEKAVARVLESTNRFDEAVRRLAR